MVLEAVFAVHLARTCGCPFAQTVLAVMPGSSEGSDPRILVVELDKPFGQSEEIAAGAVTIPYVLVMLLYTPLLTPEGAAFQAARS